MEETISLAEYTLNTLNKQIPSKTEKQWKKELSWLQAPEWGLDLLVQKHLPVKGQPL